MYIRTSAHLRDQDVEAQYPGEKPLLARKSQTLSNQKMQSQSQSDSSSSSFEVVSEATSLGDLEMNDDAFMELCARLANLERMLYRAAFASWVRALI